MEQKPDTNENEIVSPADQAILDAILGSTNRLEAMDRKMEKKHRDLAAEVEKTENEIKSENPEDVEKESREIEKNLNKDLDSAVINLASPEDVPNGESPEDAD